MSLEDFSYIRPDLLRHTIASTLKDSSAFDSEKVLTEALFSEKQRLNREGFSWLTFLRLKRDRSLWQAVRSDLLSSDPLIDFRARLEQVVSHFANEICGNFSETVYRLTTKSLPLGFNFLLNAASVKTILPWKFQEAVSDRIEMQGEIARLRKLSKLGTVLLVPTHQSHMDSVLIGYIVYLLGLPPVAYGAGLNLFSNPFLGFFMNNLGAYTVDRKKTGELYKRTLKNYSIELLRQRVHSLFFPGGGRSRSGAIESKLKLGLLGTALSAEIKNYQEQRNQPQVFIVPMVTSYHFVLEAGSLIEDYLSEAGRHRFIITNDEASQLSKVVKFFWHLFKSRSRMTVRIGSPMDVFGNIVDDHGKAIGPNGTTIDPKLWVTSCGVLGPDAKRDREYVRILGEKIVDRFYKEHPVLSSSLVAYAYFESLRKKHPTLELYALLRLTQSQRVVERTYVLQILERIMLKINRSYEQGLIQKSVTLVGQSPTQVLESGIEELGLFHGVSVVKVRDDYLTSEDLSLLYYYRNRLSGYDLSSHRELIQISPGVIDAQGFLA